MVKGRTPGRRAGWGLCLWIALCGFSSEAGGLRDVSDGWLVDLPDFTRPKGGFGIEFEHLRPFLESRGYPSYRPTEILTG